FFFEAEDGIRDFHVTGVQTCALPISEEAAARAEYDRKNSLVRYGQIEAMIDQLEALPPAEEFTTLRAAVDAVAGVPAQVAQLRDEMDAFTSASDEVPAIPGLYFHLDAQAITATDGSRIEAW